MTPQEFYSQYLPYAQSVSRRTGLDPRLVLAQAALETGYGKSAPGMNFFGIKSHGRKGGQTLQSSEFQGGQMVSQPASFRTYETPEQSFQDYADFLESNPRYKGVLSAEGLGGQIAEMAKSGYATDPQYGAKLTNIASKFDPNSSVIADVSDMAALNKNSGGILAPQQANSTESKAMNAAQPRGLLSSLGIQRMQEGAEGETGQRFYERESFKDTAATLSQAFAALGGDPAIQKFASNIASQRTEAKARNKTVEYLRQSGRNELADLVERGMIGAKDAATAMIGGETPAAFRALEYQAEAAGLAKGTPEYQQFMLSGGGAPATYRALEMQAEAAGFEKGTPEFKEFMATRGAGLQAGAKQTATNLAQTETGGEAARVVAAGAAQGKLDVEKSSDLSEMERNLGSLRVTVDKLSALSDQATYTALGRASNEVRKQLGLEPSEGAVARAEYIAVVDNQILPLLRQTFGAAFTAKEGDTLRATLGDPDKTPAEKKVVLDAFIAQKERDYAALTGGAAASPAPTSGGVTDDPLGLRN